MNGAQSILQCLDSNAVAISDTLAYRFIPDGDGEPIEVSYGLVRDCALAVAGGLLSLLTPGDRVLILLPSGLQFIDGFLGCLYAGAIAVPLYPPRPNQNFARLAAIHNNAAPSIAITTAAQLPILKARYQAAIQEGHMVWVSIESLRQAPAGRAAINARASDVAFIQYTSGSTAAPKGVVLTHGNIAHNQAQIKRAFRHDGTDHVMGWLPAFHDMGLIGNILQPLYLGVGCTLMSHLSCFDPAAFYPCYGLAEATLFVAGPAAREAPRIRAWDAATLAIGQALELEVDSAAPALPLVACGNAFGHEVRIVDPDACVEQSVGRVGEIWIRSESVAGGGYWRDQALTRQTFGGRIVSDINGAPFLRTGDLGFVDDDGDLFITGRLKDLIILRGLNHMPTDIESTVERCHPAIRQGGCAAFSLDIDGEERLVVAQEIERTQCHFDAALATDAVREQVTRSHGINVHDVVFVRHASLPRTSSGKLQRYLCAQRHREGTLDTARPGMQQETSNTREAT